MTPSAELQKFGAKFMRSAFNQQLPVAVVGLIVEK